MFIYFGNQEEYNKELHDILLKAIESSFIKTKFQQIRRKLKDDRTE